jgi:hypothetical protein
MAKGFRPFSFSFVFFEQKNCVSTRVGVHDEVVFYGRHTRSSVFDPGWIV